MNMKINKTWLETENENAELRYNEEFANMILSGSRNVKNNPHIIKDYYPINKSDIVEFIPLKKGEKGRFKSNLIEFNHIKHNGILITDYEAINKIL